MVRHTWWIFTWDKTYLRVKLATNLYQWQDENGKFPRKSVVGFLEGFMEEKYAALP